MADSTADSRARRAGGSVRVCVCGKVAADALFAQVRQCVLDSDGVGDILALWPQHVVDEDLARSVGLLLLHGFGSLRHIGTWGVRGWTLAAVRVHRCSRGAARTHLGHLRARGTHREQPFRVVLGVLVLERPGCFPVNTLQSRRGVGAHELSATPARHHPGAPWQARGRGLGHSSCSSRGDSRNRRGARSQQPAKLTNSDERTPRSLSFLSIPGI